MLPMKVGPGNVQVFGRYSNNDFDKETAETKDFSTYTAMIQFLF